MHVCTALIYVCTWSINTHIWKKYLWFPHEYNVCICIYLCAHMLVCIHTVMFNPCNSERVNSGTVNSDQWNTMTSGRVLFGNHVWITPFRYTGTSKSIKHPSRRRTSQGQLGAVHRPDAHTQRCAKGLTIMTKRSHNQLQCDKLNTSEAHKTATCIEHKPKAFIHDAERCLRWHFGRTFHTSQRFAPNSQIDVVLGAGKVLHSCLPNKNRVKSLTKTGGHEQWTVEQWTVKPWKMEQWTVKRTCEAQCKWASATDSTKDHSPNILSMFFAPQQASRKCVNHGYWKNSNPGLLGIR